jgi:uncharacterized protein (TIGR02145 family)
MKTLITSILTILFVSSIMIAQDTIYIYQKGLIVTEIAVSKIDSIIFYKTVPPDGTPVTDIDGNVYNTIILGTQEWMAENLKVTKYRNGESIPTTDPANLDVSDATHPKYQWVYGGNESNLATYGRLYTWYAVTDSRGVCPSGWHLPTDAEWKTFEMYLGMSQTDANKSMSWRGGDAYAGNKIAGNAGLWQNGTLDMNIYFGTSGFNALPGGERVITGAFSDIGNIGYFWSSTYIDPSTAMARNIAYSNDGIYRYYRPVRNSYSVRCVKD